MKLAVRLGYRNETTRSQIGCTRGRVERTYMDEKNRTISSFESDMIAEKVDEGCSDPQVALQG